MFKLSTMSKRNLLLLIAAIAACVLRLPMSGVAQTQAANATVSPLSLDQVVNNLLERNIERARDLKSYQGRRTYTLVYKGFPAGLHAEMVLDLNYTAPNTKKFTVVSMRGPKLLVDRVFRQLIKAETEAQQPGSRKNTDLNPSNYKFSNLEYHPAADDCSYTLSVEPRTSGKYLYRGRIWVHDKDFAVCRIEAEPAKNPSFWIASTRITERYARFGKFWLPVENTSQSRMRIGGTATLTITYQDYKIPAEAGPPKDATP
jgi:hypothetical protein